MNARLKISGQYIKDFSFENPNSPGIFLSSGKNSPDIGVSVNIGSSRLKNRDDEEKIGFFEVMLQIDVKAEIDNSIAFMCEIKYCGIFSIEDAALLPEEELKRALLISAPAILFPFVREVIARVTSSGGFPPLMLDVIDFEAMYNKQSNDLDENMNEIREMEN